MDLKPNVLEEKEPSSSAFQIELKFFWDCFIMKISVPSKSSVGW
jgi:hypothetical protein